MKGMGRDGEKKENCPCPPSLALELAPIFHNLEGLSFNERSDYYTPLNNPVITTTPHFREEEVGTETLNNSPKVTQQRSSRARNQNPLKPETVSPSFLRLQRDPAPMLPPPTPSHSVSEIKSFQGMTGHTPALSGLIPYFFPLSPLSSPSVCFATDMRHLLPPQGLVSLSRAWRVLRFLWDPLPRKLSPALRG